jgi:hypothetical protein
MGIRKILLTLQAAMTTEAAYTTAVMVAQMWDAHLPVLDVVPDTTQEGRMRDLFERMVAKHGLAVTDAKPEAQTATVSFAALIGREPDVVAFQASMADVVVVAHPASNKEVSSSDALHAVLFASAKPVLIAPRINPSTIGQRICIGWNGSAEPAAAVLSALPWLHRAQSIRVLWSDDYQRRGPLASELSAYLDAHDLKGKRHAVTTGVAH